VTAGVRLTAGTTPALTLARLSTAAMWRSMALQKRWKSAGCSAVESYEGELARFQRFPSAVPALFQRLG
jgi:hypothetical protein